MSRLLSSLLLQSHKQCLPCLFIENAIKIMHFLGHYLQCHDYCHFLSVTLFILNWVQDTFPGTNVPICSLLLYIGILPFCSCFKIVALLIYPDYPGKHSVQFYSLHFMQNRSFPQAFTMPSSHQIPTCRFPLQMNLQ